MDAAGAGDGKGKGNTPKEEMTCESNLGHTVKSCMTVTRFGWGAIGTYPLGFIRRRFRAGDICA